MGIQLETNQQVNNNQGNFNKADAFINVDLPNGMGDGHSRFASMALRMSDNAQAEVIEWLRQNPEQNVERLKEAMILRFVDLANQPAGPRFKLG